MQKHPCVCVHEFSLHIFLHNSQIVSQEVPIAQEDQPMVISEGPIPTWGTILILCCLESQNQRGVGQVLTVCDR